MSYASCYEICSCLLVQFSFLCAITVKAGMECRASVNAELLTTSTFDLSVILAERAKSIGATWG